MMGDRAVVLYGSVARGDDDGWSDVDLLIVGQRPEPPEDVLGADIEMGRPVRVSHYTWPEFLSMSDSGSLYLQHLAAEGKPLRFEGAGEKRYSEALKSLPTYRFAHRDVRAFRLGIRDSTRALAIGSPPVFEMAVMGGIARHASVLACYLRGEPTFGRTSIRRAAALLGIPEVGDRMELAHRFRLFEEGQCPQPAEVNHDDAMMTSAACEHLFAAMEEYVDA